MVAVSSLLYLHGIHPTMFHRWMKEFFEGGALVFQKERLTVRTNWRIESATWSRSSP
jgi:hypothetical protein